MYNNYYFLLFLILFLSLSFYFSPFLFEKNGGRFRIFKSLNYSGIWFLKMFFIEQLPFKVKVIFDESCQVKTLGVQKIFGIGDLFHHKNSDRYGFIYQGNKTFGIYSYQYKGGKLIPWEKLGEVKTNEPFYINFPMSITFKYKMGRYLYPYFEQDGDDEKGAPHTMKLYMEFYPNISNIHYTGEKIFDLSK